ncbi:MAG: hypothetical protein EP329_20110 [Deltaproteobacteria bacterium]|nr:MAG: hypothetical protein EP329_20110 [Deltaproteobacteria bacterium]
MRRVVRTSALLLAPLLLFPGCVEEQDYFPPIPEPIVRQQALTNLEPPAGYYDGADASSGAALRASLHAIIKDHTRYPYTSTGIDTWDILELADEDPNDTGRILDVYKNASYPKYGAGNTDYSREHAWPSSFGFPNDVSSNIPYTDCHMLFLADYGYNSARSNKPYRDCDATCSEEPTDVNNGRGGTTGVYPGESNWRAGAFDTGTWETWLGRRGDVARALFYMDVRYEGGFHGVTGYAEPDLILTDDQALITASQTGSNELVAYMGIRSMLLEWHLQDPVDDVERYKNAVVATYQGNRNPFVDHPEWVGCVFDGTCGGDLPPGAVTGLVATAGAAAIDLDWNDNAEPDLAGYHVYRGTDASGPWTRLNGALLAVSAYTDATATAGRWYYGVTAVDAAGGESPLVNVASAQLGDGSGAGLPWINEIHYDNDSIDTGELVEIAGPAGFDLSGWQVLGYNGNDGGVYSTLTLGGVLPDQGGCLGTLAFAFAGMQNGSPDGLALVDSTGGVVELISYEGVLTATDGPAVGTKSVDIGVSEATTTPVGYTLQLSGTGASAGDFVWEWPQRGTPGEPNAGQTFDGCPAGCASASECDDGDVCTGAESCDAGSCTPGTPLVCDDGDACTADGCDPATGCTIAAITCDDGDACTADGCDPATGCFSAAIPCDDGDACTTDGCDPATGCTTAPVTCDDGDACTADGCDPATGCTTAAITCDDGDACTTDGCDPATGCVFSPLPCDDGDACTVNACDAATGCAVVGTVSCDDGNPCTADSCDPAVGCVYAPVVDGTSCADADLCDGAEICVAGACAAGAPLTCDDGDPCTADACNPASGCDNGPVADGTSCADADLCNGDETCVAGACTAGAPLACDDGDACTTDSCDPQAGCTSTPPTCGAADGCCVEGCGDPDCGAVCGDGVCDGAAAGEDCHSCPSDCRCGGKACSKSCCGDGVCEGNESRSCPVDCGG